MKKIFKIGKSKVGGNNPTFITFEAGPTHNGLDSAKELIDQTAKSGADAIKFQIMHPERLISDRKQLIEYKILENNNKVKTVKETAYELFKRRSLSFEQWETLKKYADKKKISFFATVGFEDEIHFLKDIGCQSIKIASADLNHIPLIETAAKSKLVIQIDTGMSTLKEVENAVKIIIKNKNDKIIIHHCPSGYPAKLENINLNIIKTLKKRFDFPIGFSDHSPGYSMDVAAVSLGANLVEKTITKSRNTKSVEHMFSLEYNEMNEFVNLIKNLKTCLGKFTRPLHNQEKKKG